MALFKIFRGTTAELNTVPCKEGYAYFTEDDGKLHIDISSDIRNEDGSVTKGTRLTVNAYAADILRNAAGDEIDIEDVFLTTMTATVAQGGTGLKTLTANALLVGNGTDPIKLVSLENGTILVGDDTEVIKGLKGVGALFSKTSGTPEIGTLPIELGGTGAITAAQARQNLEVYDKTAVDDKIDEVTTKAYSFTLRAAGWVTNGDVTTYELAVAGLTCGKDGNVPPIVTYVTNRDEYSNIDSAEADPVGKKITFTVNTAKNKPTQDIQIIVVDVK